MGKLKASLSIGRIVIRIFLMAMLVPAAFFSYQLSTSLFKVIKHHINERFFTYEKIHYQFNGVLTEAIKSEISAYLDNEFSNGNLLRFSQGDFYSSIKNRFNFIKSISYRYVPSKTLLVTIEGVTPMFMVNNTSLVGDNRQLYEPILFTSSNTEALPSITMNTCYLSNVMDSNIYDLLCSINADFWQNFMLDYQGPHTIIVRQKQVSKNVKILADHQSLFDDKKFAQINTIEQNLINTKKLLETRNYELVFDLRFKKRIVTKIVDLGRRGRKNEKNLTR